MLQVNLINNSDSKSPTAKLVEHIRSAEQSAPLPSLTIPKQKALKKYKTEKRTIGLEIRADILILTEVNIVKEPKLVALHICEIPKGLDIYSDSGYRFLNQELTRFCGNLNNISLWLTVSDEQGETRFGKIPAVAEKEQADAAFWVFKREKDFDTALWAFDYRPFAPIRESGTPKIPILGALVRQESLTSLKNLAEQAFLPLSGVVPQGIAIENLFASGWLAAPALQSAILIVEDHCSHIYIMQQGHIVLSRTVKTGVNSLLASLVSSYTEDSSNKEIPLELEFNIAEEENTDQNNIPGQDELYNFLVSGVFPEGCGPRPDTDDVLTRMYSSLSRLEKQLERSLKQFQGVVGMETISHLQILAPPGCLNVLCQYFNAALGLNSTQLQLTGKMTPGANVDLERNKAKLALCVNSIGLALSGIDYTPNCLNPLKEQLKHRRLQKNLLLIKVACLILSGIFIVNGGFAWFEWYLLRAERIMVQEATLAEGPLVKGEELVIKAKKIKALSEEVIDLAERRLWGALLVEISHVTPDQIQLGAMRVIRANTNKKNNDPKAGEQANSFTAIVTGSLNGDVLYREALLTEWLHKLQLSPLVDAITVEKIMNENESTNFTATLRLL